MTSMLSRMKSNIKIILFLAFQMACPIAKAADEPLLVWYDNWLLGLSGGYANREALIQSSVTTFGNPLYYSRDASDNGWLAAVFGGYQAIHEKWLLGGEY